MIIKAQKICKSFTKKSGFNWQNFSFNKTTTEAVKGLDLEITEGEFIGFLGPNGAGKTTFLKILSGIIHPTSGKAQVMGYTPWERKNEYLKEIAIVMGQKNQLWWDLPAIDSYHLLKEVYSIPDQRFKENLSRMTEMLNMTQLLHKRLRSMSLGERMKCELVACFLHDPKVIFLDEPTIGLDVVSSQAIRNFLQEINKEKKCTMILTSHYMGDIEQLCERVVIINHGMKIYDGKLADLKNKYSPEKIIEIFLPSIKDKENFAKLPIETKSLIDSNGIIRVPQKEIGPLAEKIFSQFNFENILISNPDTEEVITKIFNEHRDH